MRNGLLLKYGEIAIKGNNRKLFENLLIKNIENQLRSVGDYRVTKEQGRILVEPKTIQLEEGASSEGTSSVEDAIPVLQKVFGIVGISPVTIFKDNSLESIAEHTIEFLQEEYGGTEHQSFKVDCRRSDKSYPLNSIELATEMGSRILDVFPGWTVDVHNPETRIMIELRTRVYVYAHTIPGPGGMPVSDDNKAALLLSGGIDSPVAGWMMAKRGVSLCGVYFHAHPYTSDRAREKVIELARRLSEYSGNFRLYVVPFTDIELDIYDHCPQDEITIIMRRLMMRIAEKIARREGAEALITGEDLGQVASQTLQSLVCTDAVCTMPVFRPLIGFDKQEIIDIAQKIDTFETSILPYEDCCTIFVAKHPVTRPKLGRIEKSELLLSNVEEAIDKAVEDSEVVILRRGRRI
ncbi:MAG: tRNA 4-thiouridine(8) synthase ThiI [Firmicutes bacterium]|nr:tRNA 4-thiouridine(8) synthase ThiI [Bacillota bacterium]